MHRELLADELGHLGGLPYRLWREMLSRESTKTVTGRDDRAYRIRITVEMGPRGAEDLRITAILETPGCTEVSCGRGS